MKPRHLLLTLAAITLYALHQDIWFWRTARPLVFGFLPIGLFYHACFSVAAALLMAALVRYAWPGHLDDDAEDEPPPLRQRQPQAASERDPLPRASGKE